MVALLLARFVGPMGRLSRWSWRRCEHVLRRSHSSAEPAKGVPLTATTSASDGTTTEGDSEECTASGSLNIHPLPEGNKDSLVRNKESKPKDSDRGVTAKKGASDAVFKQLISLGNRLRDTSSEGVWETADRSLVEEARSIGKSLRQVEWKEKRSREADEWNSTLDAGRHKKVRSKDSKSGEDSVNYFQLVQDGRKLGNSSK